MVKKGEEIRVQNNGFAVLWQFYSVVSRGDHFVKPLPPVPVPGKSTGNNIAQKAPHVITQLRFPERS